MLDEILRYRDGFPELDHSTRPVTFGVEIREANGDDLDMKSGVGSHCSQRHNCYAMFERQEIGSIVTTA